MGQVIRFAAIPRAYRATAAALDAAERLLLVAVRWWVAAFRIGQTFEPEEGSSGYRPSRARTTIAAAAVRFSTPSFG
jgi:hypothetical protein